MPLLSAIFPAPWWTHLTYICDAVPPAGVRVLAPLGNAHRVALSDGAGKFDGDSAKLKRIDAVLDEFPPLSDELMRLIKWFGDMWFVGTGLAMKTILPSKFFTEEKLPPLKAYAGACDRKFTCENVYSTDTAQRYERYRAIIESAEHALVLFPETKLAGAFWKSLPASLCDEGVLWPKTSSAQWKMWKKARIGEIRFIVGSSAAAFVPLAGLSAIVMDEENAGAWRTRKHPVFHIRAAVGMRAAFARAHLVLGGSMPSSKAFMRANLKCECENKRTQLIFVSLKDAQTSEFETLRETLPISVPLIRETLSARQAHKWAFWILDRKGYASEIICDECGAAIRCPKCASPMRWEERSHTLRCTACGTRAQIPEKCPNCGGVLLSGSRPGLEALYERARGALTYIYGRIVLIGSGERETKLPKASELMLEYPDGALAIGTRHLLSLCDELDPAVVGWIDADAETRAPRYDAKAHAFAMVWESMHRGCSAERKVVIQSRWPSRGWQDALKCGWRVFWQRELAERREWELPPFEPMLKITLPSGTAQKVTPQLEDSEIDYWVSDETPDEIWVRTKRFSKLTEILRPFYEIGAVRKAFPTVLLYLD